MRSRSWMGVVLAAVLVAGACASGSGSTPPTTAPANPTAAGGTPAATAPHDVTGSGGTVVHLKGSLTIAGTITRGDNGLVDIDCS
jgi:hypothetical protein